MTAAKRGIAWRARTKMGGSGIEERWKRTVGAGLLLLGAFGLGRDLFSGFGLRVALLRHPIDLILIVFGGYFALPARLRRAIYGSDSDQHQDSGAWKEAASRASEELQWKTVWWTFAALTIGGYLLLLLLTYAM